MCFKKRQRFKRHLGVKGQGHPAIILGKNKSKFHFAGLTHAPTTNHQANILLKKNPDPHDKEKSFIRPFSSEDDKKRFRDEKKYSDWKLSKEDRKTVREVKKNKK